MWSNVRRFQLLAGDSAAAVRTTLVCKYHAKCFGHGSQSKCYAFYRYLHVTKCWHSSSTRLAEAYADEPRIEWSTFRYRKGKNTVIPYTAVVTVKRPPMFFDKVPGSWRYFHSTSNSAWKKPCYKLLQGFRNSNGHVARKVSLQLRGVAESKIRVPVPGLGPLEDWRLAELCSFSGVFLNGPDYLFSVSCDRVQKNLFVTFLWLVGLPWGNLLKLLLPHACISSSTQCTNEYFHHELRANFRSWGR